MNEQRTKAPSHVTAPGPSAASSTSAAPASHVVTTVVAAGTAAPPTSPPASPPVSPPTPPSIALLVVPPSARVCLVSFGSFLKHT